MLKTLLPLALIGAMFLALYEVEIREEQPKPDASAAYKSEGQPKSALDTIKGFFGPVEADSPFTDWGGSAPVVQQANPSPPSPPPAPAQPGWNGRPLRLPGLPRSPRMPQPLLIPGGPKLPRAPSAPQMPRTPSPPKVARSPTIPNWTMRKVE